MAREQSGVLNIREITLHVQATLGKPTVEGEMIHFALKVNRERTAEALDSDSLMKVPVNSCHISSTCFSV